MSVIGIPACVGFLFGQFRQKVPKKSEKAMKYTLHFPNRILEVGAYV
jgi:hypothetical protein